MTADPQDVQHCRDAFRDLHDMTIEELWDRLGDLVIITAWKTSSAPPIILTLALESLLEMPVAEWTSLVAMMDDWEREEWSGDA